MATYYDQPNSRTAAARIRANRLASQKKSSKSSSKSNYKMTGDPAAKAAKKAPGMTSYQRTIQDAQARSGQRFGAEYNAMLHSVPEPVEDATFYVDSARGGGGGGGRGGGGSGGPSPAQLAQLYASMEAETNRSAGAQGDFLGQLVGGASGRIQESGSALMQALAGLRTQSQQDAERASQSISATRTGLQSSSADQLARLQADLQTQGVNTNPLQQQAELQQRDLADASGRSSGLAALLAQIQGESINNREATGRTMTAGSQNNLQFEEMLRRFAIEQQRQQELAQIAQQRLQATLGL